MRALRFAAPVAVAACAAMVLAACSSSGGNSASSSTAASGAPAAATSAAAAGSGSSGSSAAKPASTKQITIGWADPQAKQPIFTSFTQALDAAAAKANVKVTTLDGKADPATQVSDIQTFITQHVDAIIVFPLVPQAEATILNKAKAAGIKIIGLNAILPTAFKQTPAVPAPYDADLDWGYYDGAYVEGQWVAQQLHGKGNVLGIKIPVPVPSLDAMLSAYQAGVTTGHPDIHWLTTLPDSTDDLAGARTSMANAITKYHGNIQAVLSYTAALWALQLTQAVVEGKSYDKFVRLPISIVTKTNVGSVLPWDQGVSAIKSGTTPLAVTLSNDVTVSLANVGK